MQPYATSETDQAVEVTPAIQHTVPWRVVAVEVLPGARLQATFVDGTAGEIDMGALLRDPEVDGTVFESLRDPAIFREARVVLGAVQWPNGVDLAPDAMYDAIKATGRWVLEHRGGR